MVESVRSRPGQASRRLIVAAVVGLAGSMGTAALIGANYAPSVGWVCAAATFLAWTWSAVASMDASDTAGHATGEDPSKRATDVLVLGASVASLGGVGYLLVQASAATGVTQGLAAALGVVSVVISWLVVHTLFTLKYAQLYYTSNGGIDFNQAARPRYFDFAYLAFTIGMTFQVSDTSLTSPAMRATALRHALLSYLFGSFILAATVNLLASLGNAAH